MEETGTQKTCHGTKVSFNQQVVEYRRWHSTVLYNTHVVEGEAGTNYFERCDM